MIEANATLALPCVTCFIKIRGLVRPKLVTAFISIKSEAAPALAFSTLIRELQIT